MKERELRKFVALNGLLAVIFSMAMALSMSLDNFYHICKCILLSILSIWSIEIFILCILILFEKGE